MKKTIAFFIFIIALFTATIQNVNASALKVTGHMTEYGRAYKDSYMDKGGRQGHFTIFEFEGKTAYCIEPDVNTSTLGEYYNSTTPDHPLTRDTITKLGLITYFGYDYPGHQTINYRMATQQLVWETAASDPNYADRDFRFINFYETDLKTVRSVENEYNEIKRLVNLNMTYPSFNQSIVNGRIGKTIIFEDNNKVLSSGFIPDNATDCGNGKATCEIVNNSFKVTPNVSGKISVGVKKSFNAYGNEDRIFYNSGEYQDLMTAGRLPDILDEIIINTTGGSIAIIKNNADDVKYFNSATLKGAKYNVYKQDGTFITSLITDEKGYAKSNDNLEFGNYYLKEVEASYGFEVDPTIYNFTISSNGSELDVIKNVYEKMITKKLELSKYLASSETGILKPEINIEFGIYDLNDELIKVIKTDNQGYASIELAYGKYVVKQINTTTGVEKVKDFIIEINDSSPEIIRYSLANAKLKAKLKLIKFDSETNETLPIKNIKFKIFDVLNNKYVCQSITYPTISTICEYETNENGEFVTPYALEAGKYIIEEVDQSIDGYLWNNAKVEFEINDNTIFEDDPVYGLMTVVKFGNAPVKGNIYIKKLGEKLNGSTYENVPLPNITFGLYDDFGNLVTKVITDEFGNAQINNLKLGKYILKELETLNNYVLDDTEYIVELKYQDQYTENVIYEFELINKIIKSKIKINKVDDKGKALAGVKVGIFDLDDNLLGTYITNESGEIELELEYGSYYYQELETLENYILNDEKIYFDVFENDKVIESTLINVPDTLANDSKLFEIVGIALMISGIGYIIYDKKKKK